MIVSRSFSRVQLRLTEEVKKRTSMNFRRRVAFARIRARSLTSHLRPLPNLLVIGAQRCGTSSLYKYLGSHPEVGASLRKEVRFFTKYMFMGEDWYRSHFELPWGIMGPRKIFFEATPDYLFDPRVPKRVATLMPSVKLVILLRDPVVRAFSHYNHNRRLETETLSFEDAIVQENARIGLGWHRMLTDPAIPTPNEVLRFSYVMRGMYSVQIEEWFKHFNRDQIHFIKSEDFYENPRREFALLTKFLELTPWDLGRFDNFSYIGVAPGRERMPEAFKEILAEQYETESGRLRSLIGENFEWTESRV